MGKKKGEEKSKEKKQEERVSKGKKMFTSWNR